jgi:superfamily II DNA or RNA helicase
MEYLEFLKNKKKTIIESGFICDEKLLNKNLFDFQKHIVIRALKMGRFAIFADCGLGKTLMQLSWAELVVKKTKGKVLILAPLAVKGQTLQEAKKFGIDISNIEINNYEQLENIDESIYSGIVLDESSILKNFTGKYKNLIIEKFKNTPYKLACTATPSPNDLNEIGNHSEFLNVLDAQDMRAKWFVRDEGMNNYRLKGHAKKDFYGWISNWAVMLTNPSDLGFDGSKYILPELNYIEKMIETNSRDNGKLFNEGSVSATDFNKELKLTLIERFDEVAKIVNNSNESFIIWVNQNANETAAKIVDL